MEVDWCQMNNKRRVHGARKEEVNAGKGWPHIQMPTASQPCHTLKSLSYLFNLCFSRRLERYLPALHLPTPLPTRLFLSLSISSLLLLPCPPDTKEVLFDSLVLVVFAFQMELVFSKELLQKKIARVGRFSFTARWWRKTTRLHTGPFLKLLVSIGNG